MASRTACLSCRSYTFYSRSIVQIFAFNKYEKNSLVRTVFLVFVKRENLNDAVSIINVVTEKLLERLVNERTLAIFTSLLILQLFIF